MHDRWARAPRHRSVGRDTFASYDPVTDSVVTMRFAGRTITLTNETSKTSVTASAR